MNTNMQKVQQFLQQVHPWPPLGILQDRFTDAGLLTSLSTMRYLYVFYNVIIKYC